MNLDWNSIKAELLCSPNKIEIFEKASEAHYDTVLDIVVNNASKIVVNNYLRLLCSGETEYENILQFNNKFTECIGEKKYAVAHDIFGGIFAITESGIIYFSPDSLNWEDLKISYADFVIWLSTQNINEYYEPFTWSDSDDYIKNVKPNEGIIMYPFLWSKECNVNTASKRVIPFNELLTMNHELFQSL